MDSIQADIQADKDGLSALGGLCQRVAETFESDGSTVQPGPAFQSTTGAVDEVMKAAGRVENLVGVRLRVTGHSIVTAAHRLSTCEDSSRAEIDAVATGVTVK